MTNTILLLLGSIVFKVAANILLKAGVNRTEGASLASIDGAISRLAYNSILVIGVIIIILGIFASTY